MKTIFFFSIPAHGHTNPMLPVAKELVARGNVVRFYSFDEFKDKIQDTGAQFISCDCFSHKLSDNQEKRLKEVSTTEMTLQDINLTIAIDSFLDGEYKKYKPDVVYTDSVCFWGKLSAWKHNVPVVVSTSTFAFNQMSSQYMKYSFKEIFDMITGISKISKALKTLEVYGYYVKNALSLVQSDNYTDSVVYTSVNFQPYARSFSEHYAFVGPCVSTEILPDKEKTRPLVYISMGTVINDRPDFYNKCIEALGNQNFDVIISCGKKAYEYFGSLPDNILVFPYVNQLEILSKADVFITHCGMNSVSESLLMATPLVLYPQTSEQKAVAKRVKEINAGIYLCDDSVAGIRKTVFDVLNNDAYNKAAKECSEDFRNSPGAKGAADFIENAPYKIEGTDIISQLNKADKLFQIIYYVLFAALIIMLGISIGWKYVWIIGVVSGFILTPVRRLIQKLKYNSLIKK